MIYVGAKRPEWGRWVDGRQGNERQGVAGVGMEVGVGERGGNEWCRGRKQIVGLKGSQCWW